MTLLLEQNVLNPKNPQTCQDSEVWLIFALISLPESVTTCEWGTGQLYLDIEARMKHTERQLLWSSVYPLGCSVLSPQARFFFHLY